MQYASSLINFLIGYGAVQAFFIAFILLRSNKASRFNKLFAALLLIEGIMLVERLLVETEFIQTVPHLLGISYPLSFLKPLLLYFMAIVITDSTFRFERKSLLHPIPFFLMVLFNIPFYLMSGTEKIESVNRFMQNIPSYQSFEFYFSLSFFAYIGIYIFYALKKLQRFRLQVTNNALVNSYRLILLIYSGFLLLHLLYYLIQPLGQFNFALINQLSLLAMTFIIQSIAFKLMGQSTLLNNKPPDLSNLEKRKKDEALIIALFEKEKCYLDNELNLQKFAARLSMPAPYISQIINQKFSCSFKKLLARYRVQEAKERIHKAKNSTIKLIDIAYQSGFNNKVSFYRAFKEFEQIAPSAYLEKIKKEENA